MVLGVEVGFFDLVVIFINIVLLSVATIYFVLNIIRPEILEPEAIPSSEDMTSPSFKPIAETRTKMHQKVPTQSKQRRSNQKRS